MLLGALVLLRKSLRDLDAIVPKPRDMGARHVGYGAQPAHYPVVGEVLIASMAEIAGDAWRPAYSRAWADAYGRRGRGHARRRGRDRRAARSVARPLGRRQARGQLSPRAARTWPSAVRFAIRAHSTGSVPDPTERRAHTEVPRQSAPRR
jgi:hypothetical protein